MKTKVAIALFLTLLLLLTFPFYVGCTKSTTVEERSEQRSTWPPHADFGYVANGEDLILRSLNTGGEPKKVASSTFWIWSPDGKSIYYGSGDKLYSLSENGETTFVTTYEGRPRFSPDFKKVAYFKPIPDDEMTPYAKGIVEKSSLNNFKRLIAKDLKDQSTYLVCEGDIRTFDWFYDGSKLVYSSARSMEGPSDRVVIHDISTGEEDLVFQGETGGLTYWSIECSPKDPLIILGVYNGHLYSIVKLELYNYETKELRDLYEERGVYSSGFSPDGQKIDIITWKPESSVSGTAIVILDLDGSILHSLLYNDKCFDIDGENYRTRWSPEGKKISFSRHYNSDTPESDIYIWDISLDIQLPSGEIEHHVERITFDGNSDSADWNPNPDY